MISRQRHSPAYTLIELLIVISIIVIVIGVGLATYSSESLSATGLNGAANQVSAALGSARAVALRDGTDAAVLFLMGADGRIQLRVVTGAIDTNPSHTTFGSMVLNDSEDRPPERLPFNVMLRGAYYQGLSSTLWVGPATTLNPTTNGSPSPATPIYSGTSPGTSSVLVAVWFGSDGTVRTSTPSGVTSLFYTPTTNAAANLGTATQAIPMTVLLLYDNRDLINSHYADNLGNQNLTDWLNPALRPNNQPNPYNPTQVCLVSLNRYSGILVRKQHPQQYATVGSAP